MAYPKLNAEPEFLEIKTRDNPLNELLYKTESHVYQKI